MRNCIRTIVVATAAVLVLLAPDATAPAEGSRRQPAVSGASLKIWEGRHREFEEYIRTAEIDHFEDIPIGVTRPKRAFLKPGGLVASVAWKVLPSGRFHGYWESYKSEIAAYELDKLLELNMVPVTVEKHWKGQTAAATLWLSPVRRWRDVEQLPKPPSWSRQVIRMKMFDNLICNQDRNEGNLLVDDAWNLFLIDHSRAFLASREVPVAMEHIDRQLWNRIRALDEPTLAAALGRWLDRSGIETMLGRRDRMARAIAALVAKHGEPAVFVQ
jgi:hypothetical protein